jgi:putative ABC transport system permease protein
MMGSVRERTQEIGIFRAVGFRRSHIMQVVFLEAGIVSVLAGVLGYGVGWASAAGALALFGESHGGHVPFAPGLAAGAVGLALALGLAATIYPAQMAARLDPNEALRAL